MTWAMTKIFCKQGNYLDNSDLLAQKLACSVTGTGINDVETLIPPLLPASQPGMNQGAPTDKSMEQVNLL